MRAAGEITGGALLAAGEIIAPGISTAQVDEVIRRYIEKHGAKPSFLGYGGFPASACVSLNDRVIHGIPSHDTILKEGDIVKVDVGAFYRGYHGDSAKTFPVGKISGEAEKLIQVTEESFWKAVSAVTDNPHARIGDIGFAVESYVQPFGYKPVRRYVGHGVGRELHESPEVPNYGRGGHGARICEGMTIAIEPMINVGTDTVIEEADGWTVHTLDHKLSAHYEHTVAFTANGVEILTQIK